MNYLFFIFLHFLTFFAITDDWQKTTKNNDIIISIPPEVETIQNKVPERFYLALEKRTIYVGKHIIEFPKNDNVNENTGKDKFFQSIRINNQWKGDWEVYDEAGKYQYLLTLTDSAAISDYYCLQNCKVNFPEFIEHQSKKCFTVDPTKGFYCLAGVQEDTLWLEQFKNRETNSPKSFYGLRINKIIPKHFNYDETLVQIELPEAGDTMELLIAGNRFSNILIGPAKNKPAQIRIQVNDVLIKKEDLSLFLQQEMDKLMPDTKQLVIHIHADRSVSDQELIKLFKNTNIDQHKTYRVYLDSDKQRVGIRLMKNFGH